MNHPGLVSPHHPRFPIGFYIIELSAGESAGWHLTTADLANARSAYYLGARPAIHEDRRGCNAQPPFHVHTAFFTGREGRHQTNSIFVEGRWPMLWYGGLE